MSTALPVLYKFYEEERIGLASLVLEDSDKEAENQDLVGLANWLLLDPTDGPFIIDVTKTALSNAEANQPYPVVYSPST